MSRRFLSCILISLCVISVVSLGGCAKKGSWAYASRASTGLAPNPTLHKDAVVQVYGARVFGWRRIFAVHTWISVKEENAAAYKVYQVIGWYQRRNLPVLRIEETVPDGMWYNSWPQLLVDLRGEAAAALIPKIDAAARSYPYSETYTMWPGPNSNTFVAWVGRRVPELGLDLPPTAIGKDYIGEGKIISSAPSGTGFQLSLFGLAGLTLAPEEGLEINLFSLNFGIDFKDPALRLPLAGRIGSD